MNKCLSLAAAALLFAVSPMAAVETKAGGSKRFYGTITAIDPAQKSLTAFNKKRNADVQFVWNADTTFTANKQATAAGDLKVGQFVIVSYSEDAKGNVAKKVTVRAQPFRRKGAPEQAH